MKQVIFLFILAALLVACAETKVVQIDATQPSETTETQPAETTETTETQAPASTGVAADTGGKVATACDDMDADSPSDPGVVEVTYSDGTTEKFYDTCPGKDIGNDLIVTEYTCDGDQPKTKNYVCSKSVCMMFSVKTDPSKQVGACI